MLNSDDSMLNNLRNMTKADCINCDFMQTKDINNKVKKAIREYAESKELVFQENMDGWTSQDLNPIKHNGV